MDSETDLDDTVGDSEDEDLLLQQAGRRQSKSRCDSCSCTYHHVLTVKD